MALEITKEPLTVPCFYCGEAKILSWSSTNTPTLSHSRKEDFCPYDNNSELPSMARNILLTYLINHGGLIINTTCKCCHCITARQFSSRMQYEPDEDYDILCRLGESSIRLRISFDYLHEDNNDIIVQAKDILYSLTHKKASSFITLTNLHQIKRCASFSCLTLKDIAARMGYLSFTQWHLHCTNWDYKLWQILIVREECLKCGLHWQTGRGRPYCIRCYREILRSKKNLLIKNTKAVYKNKPNLTLDKYLIRK